MKKFKAIMILLVMEIVFPIVIMAQPPRPPSDPGTAGNQSLAGTTGTPIEPGTGILLILAAVYGLKELKKSRVKEGKS
jgi:hypothetical protein